MAWLIAAMMIVVAFVGYQEWVRFSIEHPQWLRGSKHETRKHSD